MKTPNSVWAMTVSGKWTMRRVGDLLSRPGWKLLSLIPALLSMASKLHDLRVANFNTIPDMDEIGRLVRFFQITSPVSDRLGEIDDLLELQRSSFGYFSKRCSRVEHLRDIISKAGRMTEMNRTDTGEDITEWKVFIGGKYGVPWRACRVYDGWDRETNGYGHAEYAQQIATEFVNEMTAKVIVAIFSL